MREQDGVLYVDFRIQEKSGKSKASSGKAGRGFSNDEVDPDE